MPGEQKRLGVHGPSERRDHLRRYLMTCVRDNVLSLADITNAPNKIMKTITADLTALAVEAKEMGIGALKTAGGTAVGALFEIARDVVAGRRK